VGGIGGYISAPLYCATKHAMVGFVKSMRDTEPLTGVKVTTVCPGRVFTPLFDEAKTKQYSMSKECALMPETCAEALLALLQKKDYPCGSVLEITLEGTKLVPEWNVEPRPEMTKRKELVTDTFVENLMEPIKRTLEGEKGEK
jgi:short-subunit dehydrogenase